MTNPRILHLVPHLGGGVGTVIRSYVAENSNRKNYVHTIVALDTLNSESKELFTNMGVEWVDNAHLDQNKVCKLISKSDILLIHWWNHPLLQEILMNKKFPKCRIILWAHISGSYPPNNFTEFTLTYPDKFILTTPLSYLSSDIQSLPQKMEGIGCIWSTAGVENLKGYKIHRSQSIKNSKIIVGYTGNLDYTKLNTGFLEICRKILDLEFDIEIKVIGPVTKKFKQDLGKLGLSDSIYVTGYISEADKFKLMQEFDIFLYPLSRNHYGTCDQALQEAMYFGAVPVVLNNGMENHMIENGKTGIVAENIDEIVLQVKKLLSNPEYRKRISRNSSRYAKENFSLKKMSTLWKAEFKNILKLPKKNHNTLNGERGRKLQPYEVFLASLGTHSAVFAYHKLAKSKGQKVIWERQLKSLSSDPKWASPTKSSPAHFARFFPQDRWLKKWSELTRPKLM
jgi:glycosyltransferase involved in cell wall biosynthesis